MVWGVGMAVETIFLAEPNADVRAIYPEYKSWYENARPILERYVRVVALDLPDIWVRDFLPLQNRQTGKLHQPLYLPSLQTATLNDHYAACRAAARCSRSARFGRGNCRPVERPTAGRFADFAGIEARRQLYLELYTEQ